MKSAQFSVAILSQLREVANQLKGSSYSQTLDVFSGASIGQHVRHILEFYICLLEQKDLGEISYDLRKREIRLEEDSVFALDQIDTLINELQEMRDDHDVFLVATLQGETIKTPSSLSRELLYALEHAVHHMAIIKIGLLVGCPDVKIPVNFGVADSTVQYRDQCAQ